MHLPLSFLGLMLPSPRLSCSERERQAIQLYRTLVKKKCQPGEEKLINMFLQRPAFSCPFSKKEELDPNDVPLSRYSSVS